jgi:hypothetical protein
MFFDSRRELGHLVYLILLYFVCVVCYLFVVLNDTAQLAFHLG